MLLICEKKMIDISCLHLQIYRKYMDRLTCICGVKFTIENKT